MSEANDSEGGRASEDSCCAMNKERVNSNGCEAVSTPGEQSERQRDWPVWEDERSEGGEKIPPPAPGSYIVLRISYVVKNKILPTIKEGFEAKSKIIVRR